MNIASLCQREIVSVSANASVRQAAEAMRHHHVGALVVTDAHEGGQAIGIVTDRDLVMELLAQGRSPEGVAIGTLCRSQLVGVPGGATVQDAVQAMQRAGVRRLVVVDDGGRLLGVLSADDLFEQVANELDGLAGALRNGIEREGLRTTTARRHADSEAIYLPRHEP